MGVVYRAWDPRLRREVALKSLRGPASERLRRRLLREARSVAGLEHPSIVPLYECHDEGDLLFLTMRLVHGPPLSRLCPRQAMAPAEAARITATVARALAHAHQHGIVHRDVKPGNILMEDGRPLLADFGLARRSEPTGESQTEDVELLGTPAYMAPEQIRGGPEAALPASDQYALGVVFYELLSGIQPYRGDSPMQIFARVLSERPTPLSPEVPPTLAAICLRAMARRPDDRFPNLDAMAEALEGWARGDHVVMPRPSLARRAWRATARLPLLPLATLSALVIVAATLGWRTVEHRYRELRAESLRQAMETNVARLLDQGQTPEADAAFAAFAALPECAETRALFRGWVDQAARLSDRGQADDANEALGAAYSLAPDEHARVEALTYLAIGLWADEQWGPLRSALSMLARAGANGAVLRPIWRDVATLDRNFVGAERWNDDPDQRPLITFLQHASPVGRAAPSATVLDIDGDGQVEIGLHDGEKLEYFVVGRWAAPVAEVDLTGVTMPFGSLLPRALVVEGRPGHLILQQGHSCSLVTPAPTPRVDLRWTCDHPYGATAGDLDQDGETEIYVGDARRLLTTQLPDEDGPRDAILTDADASLSNANSEIRGLAVVDADSDGRGELLVGSGGWRAYDLRVYGREGGRLKLRARARVGEVLNLAVLRGPSGPLIAVLTLSDPMAPANRYVYREGAPQGGRSGIHLLSLGADGLSVQGFIPVPPVSGDSVPALSVDDARLLIGDIDGDGLDEIALDRSDHNTSLYRRDERGDWNGATIADFRPLAFVDADGDGEDELLVRAQRDQAIWTLGTGAASLPLRRVDPVEDPAPPLGLPEAVRADWRRAEVLLRLGAPGFAAERFRALAGLGRGPEAEGEALLRAAELFVSAGQDASARRLYTLAASDTRSAGPALEALFRMASKERRFSDALSAASARLALPNPPPEFAAAAAALSGLATLETTYDLSQPQPAWRIDAAVGASRAQRGLVFRSAGATRLMHLPVRREPGSALRIELDVERRSLDWGVGISLGLAPRGGEVVRGVRIEKTGGGGIYSEVFFCPGWPERRALDLPEGGALVGIWEVGADGAESCRAVIDETDERRVVFTLPQDMLPSGELDLVLGVTGELAFSELLVRRVSFSGLSEATAPETPVEQANALLMVGKTAEALEAVHGQPVLASAVALVGLGRVTEAGRLLARLPEDLRDQQVRALLLLAPDQYAEPARIALGPRYFSEFLSAFAGQVTMNVWNGTWRLAFTTQLDGVDRPPANLTEALKLAELLRWRGRAWRDRGNPAAARRDLALARQRADGPGAEAGLLRADILLETALLDLDAGDADAAMHALLEALETTPSPEVFADILTARPDLDPLHARTEWIQVEGKRGVLVW